MRLETRNVKNYGWWSAKTRPINWQRQSLWRVSNLNFPIPAALLASLRAAWPRTFFLGGSFDLASGQAAVDAGESDLVGIGRAFIANPDLVTRLKNGTPLAAMNGDALYTPGAAGYTDYPNA